ncbi:MAG: hypothetical protein HY890_05150 [Deltaproteobacteria bacterium]|nr:hypothetical protein [Deltaproteobacteria bacterium]
MSNVYKLGQAEAVQPFVPASVKPAAQYLRGGVSVVEREAYEKGFAAGEKAGMEMGQEKMNGVVKRLATMLDELLNFKKRFYSDREREVAELIMRVAEKVVHAELSINRDIVINSINIAVKAVNAAEDVLIKLNPSDMDYLLRVKPDVLKNLEDIKGFRVEGDGSVGRGGCLVETRQGEVDARLEQGLRVMETAMREALGSEAGTSKDGD